MSPHAGASSIVSRAVGPVAATISESSGWLLAILAALTLAVPTVSGAQPMPLTTPAGPVQGVLEGGVAVFRGLPYAEPPTGALRWRAPLPLAPWTQVRAATAAQPACPQKRGLSS